MIVPVLGTYTYVILAKFFVEGTATNDLTIIVELITRSVIERLNDTDRHRNII